MILPKKWLNCYKESKEDKLWHQEHKVGDKAEEEARSLQAAEEAWAEAVALALEEIVFVPIVAKSSPMRGESLVSNTSAPNAARR